VIRTYFYHTPSWLKRIYPDCIWSIPTSEKVLYLTFDDGPVPEATTWVLDQLEQFQAKATFFVVGDNVRKHPEVLKQVIENGHAIGNHTYHHVSGWGKSYPIYLEEIQSCEELLSTFRSASSPPLFRPPYGRITPRQARRLSQHYQLIMWECLSGDFDLQLNRQKSIEALLKLQPGSIVVFHDSMKYLENVQYLLPRFLKEWQKRGYIFQSL
jgi:peptidoglycan/xylan/chitin deacetylase (PgdA/CDA1 family)